MLKDILLLDIRKYTLNLKPIIKHIEDMSIAKNIYDLSVAAYLINPLKDSYLVEDIVRDFIGGGVLSRTEMLGKQSLYEILKEDDERALKYFGTESSVDRKSVV